MKSRFNRKYLKVIFAIALPIMIQNIIQHLMILTDRAFLGNLNSRYLASLGNVMVPFNTLTFVFFALSTGIIVLVAQNIGAKDNEKARRYGETSFFFSTIISLGLFLFWFFASREVFVLFGTKGEILEDAVRYVRILSIHVAFLGIDITAASILQGAGITRPIMVFGIIKSVLNVFLDWVMVFGKLGFPAMGLEGAALATTVSSIIGSVGILVIILVMRGLPFQLNWRELLRPEWKLYHETLKISLPSAFESFLWSSGQVVMACLLNRIDGMAIGIYSLVYSIQVFSFFLYFGIARAAMTMVGQYWGEGSPEKAKDIGMHCLKLSFVTTIISGAIFIIFPEMLLKIFTSDISVIERAIPLMRVIGLTTQFQALNVVTGHAIRATGDTKWMMFSQIFGTCFVIGTSTYLILGLSLGLMGVFLTVLLDEFVRGWINFARFYHGKNPLSLLMLAMRKPKEIES